jgi:NAD(P)H-flavin reductase
MAIAQNDKPETRMDPMIPQPYTVVRKRRETHDTVTLFMEPTDKGAGTMVFDPGQFNMLYLPGKVF